MIQFRVIGAPVSTNATYLRGKGRRFYKSAKSKIWSDQITAAALSALRGRRSEFPLEGPVSVSLDFYFQSARNDIDGCIKGVLDAMQGIMYDNDRQVTSLAITKWIAHSPNPPGVAVTVRLIEATR